ncbi:MAG: right-handed parallel beta-helix repeat-containing protein [Spirochaetota bacterium]
MTYMRIVRFIPSALCAFCLIAHLDARGADGSIFERHAYKDIYVALSTGNDAGTGGAQSPFASIQRGIDELYRINAAGYPSRLVIRPGVYRASVYMTNTPARNDLPIIIEAIGAVMISGADIWNNGWQRENGVYRKPWPYAWSVLGKPSGWETVKMKDIVRRSEMVIVNGRPLLQASAMPARDDTFFIDDTAGMICLRTKADPNGTHDVIEVAVRPLNRGDRLMLFKNISNLLVRGLTVTHARNASFPEMACGFLGMTNLVVERCTFVQNNWGGMNTGADSSAVTIRGCGFISNGITGGAISGASNVLVEGLCAEYNNWRGIRGGFWGWGIAGNKSVRLRDAQFRNCSFSSNQTFGLWFDVYCHSIMVESSRIRGNRFSTETIEDGGYGLNFELSIGLVVSNCIIADQSTGLLSEGASNMVFIDSVFSNHTHQHMLFPMKMREQGNTGEAWWPSAMSTSGLSLFKNRIGYSRARIINVFVKDEKEHRNAGHFIADYHGDENEFYAPKNSGFTFLENGRSTNAGLSDWQRTSGQDKRSINRE